MELKKYNTIQIMLFEEYNIIDISVKDIIEFNKICSLLSIIRDKEDIYSAIEEGREIILKELNNYNGGVRE